MITILAIGKLREPAYAQLAAEYQKRLPWKLTTRELKASRKDSSADRKSEEATSLLAAIPKGSVIIALDERGKTPTSPEFSKMLTKIMDAGQNITIIIGGADGLDPSIRQAAKHIIAFGALTWPHQMIRAMLAEQLYRAHTISKNHPYHRE